MRPTLVFLAVVAASSLPLHGGPKVDIVVEENAAALEQLAAEELAGYLRQLYAAEVNVRAAASRSAEVVVLIGSPQSNRAVREAGGVPPETWDTLSAQGMILQGISSAETPTAVVGGGSPVATLWAVYELAYRLGVRPLLSGDVLPQKPPPLDLSGLRLVLEPTLRTRTWSALGDAPTGPAAWGYQEHARVLRQLAKAKFNRVLLDVRPSQPFLDYAFGGVDRASGALWAGQRFPVDGDTAGKAAFGGAAEFVNPDVPGDGDYGARSQAGRALARGVLKEACRLGMSTAVALAPFEFPVEFAAVVPGAVAQAGKLTARVGVGSPKDAKLTAFTRARIRALLRSYPEVDALYLNLVVYPDWPEADKEVFLRTVLGDGSLLRRPDGGSVDVGFIGSDLVLTAVAKMFPDLSCLHVVAPGKSLRPVPKALASRHGALLPLVAGVMPRLSTSGIEERLSRLRLQGWSGLALDCGVIGDLDPLFNYLSRVTVDAEMTVTRAHEELLAPICPPDVAARLLRGFELLERAAEAIAAEPLAAALRPGMILHHLESAEPAPASWSEVKALYNDALIEMHRARFRVHSSGQELVMYVAKRAEFATAYLAALDALRQAGAARRSGEGAAALEHLEAAVESLYNGIDALREVARSSGDRGLIAVLNEFGYRPLVREYEAALERLEGSQQ